MLQSTAEADLRGRANLNSRDRGQSSRLSPEADLISRSSMRSKAHSGMKRTSWAVRLRPIMRPTAEADLRSRADLRNQSLSTRALKCPLRGWDADNLVDEGDEKLVYTDDGDPNEFGGESEELGAGRVEESGVRGVGEVEEGGGDEGVEVGEVGFGELGLGKCGVGEGEVEVRVRIGGRYREGDGGLQAVLEEEKGFAEGGFGGEARLVMGTLKSSLQPITSIGL